MGRILITTILIFGLLRLAAQTVNFPISSGATSAGGSNTQVQYNNGGAFGGISRVTSNGTNMFLTSTAYAPTASSNKAIPFSKNNLGYSTFNVDTDLDSSNILAVTTPSYLTTHNACAGAGSTLVSSTVGVPGTSMGTATSVSIGLTDAFDAAKKIAYTTSSTNTNLGFRHQTLSLIRATTVGGFAVSLRFALQINPNNAVGFIGIDTVTNAPAIGFTFNNLLSLVGVGWDLSDANLSLVHNDGSGTITKTTLGSNFPVNNRGVYNLKLVSVPGVSGFAWTITNYANNATSSGVVNTNMPVSASVMAPKIYAQTRAAVSTSLHFMQIYVENY